MSTDTVQGVDTTETKVSIHAQPILESLNELSSRITAGPTAHRRLEPRYDDVCPIEKLHPDELKIIFEICSEGDWVSPLRISAVCKRWRTIANNTPRAWTRCSLLHLPSLHIAETYFTRSRHLLIRTCPQCVRTRTRSNVSWTRPIMDLIERNSAHFSCLYLGETGLYDLDAEFVNVRSLTTRYSSRGTSIDCIPGLEFPSLRQLHAVKTGIRFTIPFGAVKPIPPIQQLNIITDGAWCWVRVIHYTRHTLVSLSITILSGGLMEDGSLDLPLLRYLEINPSYFGGGCLFRARTPLLLSYLDSGGKSSEGWLVDVDCDLVSHVYLEDERNLSRFPSLYHLRLPFEPLNIVERITRNPTFLSKLETIEYKLDGGEPFSRSVERQIPGATHAIRIFPSIGECEWHVKFPGHFLSCDELSSPLSSFAGGYSD